MAPAALAESSLVMAAPVAQAVAARVAETVPRELTRRSRALMVATAAVPVLVAVVVMVALVDARRVLALPVSAVLPVPVAG